MNKLDYTEEEYKEMCAKLNQFKSTRSIVDRDVLTKQFCDVFHIAENSLIKFFKKAKILKNERVTHPYIVHWVDEGPIYIGKVKEAVRLYKEYNLDRDKKYLSKKCKPSIQDCINILKKEGYKIYKEKIEWVEI